MVNEPEKMAKFAQIPKNLCTRIFHPFIPPTPKDGLYPVSMRF
jgi:hypothetical protein